MRRGQANEQKKTVRTPSFFTVDSLQLQLYIVLARDWSEAKVVYLLIRYCISLVCAPRPTSEGFGVTQLPNTDAVRA